MVILKRNKVDRNSTQLQHQLFLAKPFTLWYLSAKVMCSMQAKCHPLPPNQSYVVSLKRCQVRQLSQHKKKIKQFDHTMETQCLAGCLMLCHNSAKRNSFSFKIRSRVCSEKFSFILASQREVNLRSRLRRLYRVLELQLEATRWERGKVYEVGISQDCNYTVELNFVFAEFSTRLKGLTLKFIEARLGLHIWSFQCLKN